MFGFDKRQGESAVAAGFRNPEKRKLQIEVNSPSSDSFKKFKWNGAVHTSDEIGNGENNLASTLLRQFLLNNVSPKQQPLVKSEKIFRDKFIALLYGIDKCAGNPAQWSKVDTNVFHNKMICFVGTWYKVLLKENKKRDLVADQLNLLTSVYHESLKLMKFSAVQKKAMDSKVKKLSDLVSTFSSLETMVKKDRELNEARKQAGEYQEELRKMQDSLNEAYLKFNESSLATELKNKDHELNEAKKQADEYLEELRKTQKSLNEAHLERNYLICNHNPLTQVDQQVIPDGCLQDKEKQLNELKKLLVWSATKQKETEDELTETREQLQSFVAKSREMIQTKQKDTIKKLSEIQTLLLMKNPNYRPSCQTETESLNKEEKIFQDIKTLLEYEMNLAKSDTNCKQNTTESALKTNSTFASLRVSEYEVHLVTLIAAFLKITPFPVSSHSIYSYVVNIDNAVDLQLVESLLRKFPSFFKEVAGASGSMDKNWIYLDLKPVITI